MSDTDKGLFHKYEVQRVDGRDGPGEKHEGCEYFVLDVSHDKFAHAALGTYVRHCTKEYPELAHDIRTRYMGGFSPSEIDARELMEAWDAVRAARRPKGAPATPPLATLADEVRALAAERDAMHEVIQTVARAQRVMMFVRIDPDLDPAEEGMAPA